VKKKILVGLLAMGLALGVISTSTSAGDGPEVQHLVYQLKGSSVAENLDIDTDGDGIVDTNADCFVLDLIDPSTGKKVGTAIDCLSGLDIVADDDPANQPLGFNIALTGTTFFETPGGTLVTQGLTTVRPVLQPTMRDGINFSHITGANGDGGVQYGTKRFQGVSGKARLSGLVNLSKLLTDGEITFDCLFVIDLER